MGTNSSIEEKVEDYYKSQLKDLGIRIYSKTESMNQEIDDALKAYASKSGGTGNNYPDIRLFIANKYSRRIPVMIEAKGSKGKLEKLNEGSIELVSPGKNPNRAVQSYAVNGALHYGMAILKCSCYDEVIIIGINGTTLKDGSVADPELKAYYVSKKNACVAKEIHAFSFEQVKPHNINALFSRLDAMILSSEELESAKRIQESSLECNIKKIHQRIYDDPKLRTMLGTNEKLFFFCGLIMAGLTTNGVSSFHYKDLKGDDSAFTNDGVEILNRVKAFLTQKGCSQEKIQMVYNQLEPVFTKRDIWKPSEDGKISIIRDVYRQVEEEIIPLLQSNLHLDFTGKILNSLSDWIAIENDRLNDVVLTPRFVANLMARIAQTNCDSFVWDICMGSSSFLISAMEIMIADAKVKISDQIKLNEKIDNIRKNQLLGIEILGNIYILAVLNMILMGDGSSQVLCGDSHEEAPRVRQEKGNEFPANVFLLNPPYSAKGKGLIFVDEALTMMETGFGAVLIQENAGSGQGDIYAKNILKRNTLRASIHMPADLFNGKSSVQTAIYLFEVNRPHEEDDEVIFIDFSVDGYSRQNRKKSTQEVNLRNTDHALERYDEIVSICLGKKPKTEYYTESNGKVVKDTITLNGNDWTFNQHKKIDTTPAEEDFKKTVADYLAWRVSTILKGQMGANE